MFLLIVWIEKVSPVGGRQYQQNFCAIFTKKREGFDPATFFDSVLYQESNFFGGFERKILPNDGDVTRKRKNGEAEYTAEYADFSTGVTLGIRSGNTC